MPRFSIRPIGRRVAVLASGGLDSSVLVAELAAKGRDVFPIYVRAGLAWESAELRALRRFLESIKSGRIAEPAVLSQPSGDIDGEHWSITGRSVPGFRAGVASNYILGRTLSLLVKAALFSARNRIGEIAIASLEENPFPDATPAFFRSFARTATLGLGLPLRIVTPYAGLSKWQVIRRAAALPLALTLSCARPRRGLHCGTCTKCAERARAFARAGVADPTRYAMRRRAVRRTARRGS
jgi:7-cyano-7-deazaguanine synthase